MVVMLENARTGDRRPLSIGWNWTFFFFGPVLGIPLFWKGLSAWGAVMVMLWGADVILPIVLPAAARVDHILLVPMVLMAGLTIFLAHSGNAMIGKKYLARGYEFARPFSAEARFAARRWGLLA